MSTDNYRSSASNADRTLHICTLQARAAKIQHVRYAAAATVCRQVYPCEGACGAGKADMLRRHVQAMQSAG